MTRPFLYTDIETIPTAVKMALDAGRIDNAIADKILAGIA